MRHKVTRNVMFGKRLNCAITSQKQAFARKIGVRPHQLSRYLGGQLPRISTLIRIAAVTGESLDWLVLGKEKAA